MTRGNLSELTVEELVERFTSMAIDQDDALLQGETSRYNRLYDRIKDVATELKRRLGDQRHALLPLLQHQNAQVRLKAAIMTLAIAPDRARQTLERIVDGKEFPQAAYASGMMSALDEGRYKPV